MDRGWFESEALTDFPTERARAAPGPNRSSPALKPVQVYVMMGQSNMVGIGQVRGPNRRWGAEMRDPVVSVYAGPFDPTQDYDALEPLTVQPLDAFGGVRPTPYPGGGTHVTRGTVQVEESGIYAFHPGCADSTYNVWRSPAWRSTAASRGRRAASRPCASRRGPRALPTDPPARPTAWAGSDARTSRARSPPSSRPRAAIPSAGRGRAVGLAGRRPHHRRGHGRRQAPLGGLRSRRALDRPELGFGWVLGDHEARWS